MSFRFRRSIKIIPGIHLNVGKRGLSVSAGVKGARLTFGGSGTRMTMGLPGTGLSYTTKLDIGSSGGRYYDRSSGLPLTKSQVNAELRRQHKVIQIDQANSEIRHELDQYERFTKIASFAPNISPISKWQEALIERAFAPEIYGIEIVDLRTEKSANLLRIWKKLFRKFSLYSSVIGIGLPINWLRNAKWSWSKIELQWSGTFLAIGVISAYFVCRWLIKNRAEAVKVAQLAYSDFLNRLENARMGHPNSEAERVKRLKLLMDGNEQLLELQLSEDFEDLANEFAKLPHSFKTGISFHIQSSNRVFLDVDLPEIEDVVITEAKTILKSGKLSEKAKNKTTINREYAEGILGLAFHFAAHVFDASPAIHEVVVSGFTQRVNRKTGNIQSDYVYSVRFDRTRFCGLNLKAIEPIASISIFNPRLELSKTFEFSCISPYEEKERDFGT